MSFALCVLKWSPDQLWKATLPEIDWAARTYQRQEGTHFTGGTLAEMMKQFPDGEQKG
ncbi:MAG: hypothetical protein COA62_11160 [Rhodobiaceae bacterium]|nr:MAG: hypothetical protein COA62_11160 [Rhodobiaceae bacterium]